MENNNRGSNQPNQKPVRPQQQPGQRPVRPQQQGQRSVRPQQQQSQQPVRPQQQKPVRPQQQKPVRPQQQKPVRPQQQKPVRQESIMQNYEQGQTGFDYDQQNFGYEQQDLGYEQQVQDNNFEDFNSEVVNDTVAENKARGKKQKKIKQKKVLTPEQKKKQTAIFGAIAIIIVVLVVSGAVITNLVKKSKQHINVAGNIPQQEQPVNDDEQQVTEDETVNADLDVNTNDIEQEDTKPEQVPVVNIDAKECSEQSPLDINEYTYMNLIVNTKTAQDKTYTDKEAKVYTKLSNVVTGYNNVANYIKEYNETNTQNKNITLPSSLDYYKQSNGTEMVMIEFELLYPANFPTSASSGVVYRIPQASINVFGTVEEIDSDEITSADGYDPRNYIVVDDVIYNVSKITDISVYERNADKGIKVGEPIVLRYITALPVGASSNVYGIKLDIDLDTEDTGKDSTTYWFKGQSITASDELKEAQEQLESTEQPENNEEQSENSDEQIDNNEEQSETQE